MYQLRNIIMKDHTDSNINVAIMNSYIRRNLHRTHNFDCNLSAKINSKHGDIIRNKMLDYL